MFSVTKTELNVFPLCTKNVWPTKSGVTIDRRDQVLIGFFTPALFILSIFSRRWGSTNGPFLSDLLISNYFFRLTRRSCMMKRSLDLCFERVLKPFANCPQGLVKC